MMTRITSIQTLSTCVLKGACIYPLNSLLNGPCGKDRMSVYASIYAPLY